MIKLSICIATHNRAKFIDDTLKSFINQITDECEIVIYDSLSNDNTSEIVKKFSDQNKNIKYFYSDQKMGIDIDYNNCINLASGHYCWLFSDDDTIEDNTIFYILEKINKNIYDLIIVNSAIYDIDLNKKISNKYLQIQEDIEFVNNVHSQEKFFTIAADYLSFIGCVIISRKIWLEREKDKYFGSEFIHVGVIFQNYFKNKILIIANPFIKIRLGNSQWYGRAYNIWVKNWPNLIWSFKNFSDVSKNKIIPRYPYEQIKKLSYFKALGIFSIDKFNEFTKPKSLNMLMKYYFVKLLVYSPRIFIKYIYVVYTFLFNRKYMLRDLLRS